MKIKRRKQLGSGSLNEGAGRVYDVQMLDIKPCIRDLDSKFDANHGRINKIKGVSVVEIEKKIRRVRMCKSCGIELLSGP